MYPDPNLIPIAKTDVEGVSKSDGVNILTSDITPSKAPSLFRINIQTAVAAKFKANVTVGSTEYQLMFNAGSDLTASSLYAFDMLVHDGDSVNFELDDNCTGIWLRVQEIPCSL